MQLEILSKITYLPTSYKRNNKDIVGIVQNVTMSLKWKKKLTFYLALQNPKLVRFSAKGVTGNS